MRLALVGVVLLLAAGCTAPCGPSSCYGCCDENGACVTGQVDAACGSNGGRCLVCRNGDTCQRGQDTNLCLSGGGGGAGGSGGGGGGAGGGGAAGIVFAGADQGATWRLGGSDASLSITTQSLTGRAGLPASAVQVLLRFDICILENYGLDPLTFSLGSPNITPQSIRFVTSRRCQIPATGTDPTQWTTEEHWVQLEPATQSFQLGWRSTTTSRAGAMWRLTLRAWQQ